MKIIKTLGLIALVAVNVAVIGFMGIAGWGCQWQDKCNDPKTPCPPEPDPWAAHARDAGGDR